MPRRRLSERQIARIRTIQERRRQHLAERAETTLDAVAEETGALSEPEQGIVVVRHGANLAVEDARGAVHHCLARRNIGHPVCGDRVVWQRIGNGDGIVTAVQPRTTVLSRPDYSGRDKPLAANLTRLVVLIAPEPEPGGYLIDQYLVAAELMGIPALLVANKMDLLDAHGEVRVPGAVPALPGHRLPDPVDQPAPTRDPAAPDRRPERGDQHPGRPVRGRKVIPGAAAAARPGGSDRAPVGGHRARPPHHLGRHLLSPTHGRLPRRFAGGAQLSPGWSGAGRPGAGFSRVRTLPRRMPIPGLPARPGARLRPARGGGARGDQSGAPRELPSACHRVRTGPVMTSAAARGRVPSHNPYPNPRPGA